MSKILPILGVILASSMLTSLVGGFFQPSASEWPSKLGSLTIVACMMLFLTAVIVGGLCYIFEKK